MLYTEDLKIQIVKKLRSKGFQVGARDEHQQVTYPYIELEVESDNPSDSKQRCFNSITMVVEIVANGKDELSSKVNDVQQGVMRVLTPLTVGEGTDEEVTASQYKGDEHYIEFGGFDTIVYIEEDDENFNIFRRRIPCNYIVQSNNF